MNYSKIREKRIPKYSFGSVINQGDFTASMKQKQLRQQQIQALGIAPEDAAAFTDDELSKLFMAQTRTDMGLNTGEVTVDINNPVSLYSEEGKFAPPERAAGARIVDYQNATEARADQIYDESADRQQGQLSREGAMVAAQQEAAKKRQALYATNRAFGVLGFNAVQTQEQKTDEDGNKVGLSEQGQMALGITSQAVSKTVNAVDEATMGDKNFSASSKAIDSTVHGVSGALMKSGNPYAMAAGAALEVINFATKAGGKNVPGYDVNINNSGYGNLGHQESEAGRVWDNWTGATARKLKKRNEQARMALAAMDVSNDIAYEQEARANSVTNVLQANQIALAGGIDTSLLGN